jgi:formate C-acetyltransferase
MVKLHGDVSEGDMNVSSVQTLTLGGLNPDGSDATSDLTRLFLQAIRNVRLLRPTVYVRCHDQTPEDVLELAVTMLGEGLAEPNFFGDRPIVEGLTRVGIPLEDARGYALSGCAEVCSPGLGNWGAPNGWLNFALLADESLRECAVRGLRAADAIWDVIAAHVATVADACQVCNTWVDEQTDDPRFAATLFMPVCLETCHDIAHGGARTHLGHWEGLGLPNAADMVSAALHLVDGGEDLGEDLAGVFSRLDAGDEELRLRLRSLPRFGNADPAVDQVAARLVRLMADALEARATPMRPALVLGHLAGGENLHIGAGAIMGPTLDGRRAGATLADSMAGSQGITLGGPTAAVRSLCALDHSRIVAGNVSTLRLSPADFATPADRAKVVALVRTYIALGGSQLQINVADAATLRAAQEDPAEYAGLMVRVAGYSADFTHVGRGLQDEIIARTEGLA